MKFFNTHSFSAAVDIFCSLPLKIKKVESNLFQSQENILANDVFAKVSSPDFTRSTVDGYAVRFADTAGASEQIPAMLAYVGEVAMGCASEMSINSGEAVYLPTGAMLPAFADAVVMLEYTEKIDNFVLIKSPVSMGENIVYKGDDFAREALLAEKGTKITYKELALFAAGGVENFTVYDKINIAIISTGDELVAAGEPLILGKIYDINTVAIAAMAKKIGANISYTQRVKDDLQAIKSALTYAAERADVVVLSGGSSVGAKDYTATAIAECGGEVLVSGVAVKPGKPTIVAKLGGKPILGLPGHPFAAMVIFSRFFAQFLIKKLSCAPQKSITAKVSENVHSAGGMVTHITVSVKNGIATPIYGKSAHIGKLPIIDGYIVINENKEGVLKGEKVEVFELC